MGIPLAGCSRWRVERIDECKKNRSCMVFVKLVVAVLGLMRRNAAGSAVSSGSISLRKNNQEGTRHDSDKSNGQGDNGACRVAVCLSGAIRSFVHHAVHGSIKGNLIEAIQGDDCEVDVFAYATGKDVVGSGKEVTSCFLCMLVIAPCFAGLMINFFAIRGLRMLAYLGKIKRTD